MRCLICGPKIVTWWHIAVQVAIRQMQSVACGGSNMFGKLIETVKVTSLDKITDALFNVGGQYRRNM